MSTLTVDIFVSVDGWAGSDGLPGYFGYLGPDLEEWISRRGPSTGTLIMGRKTYELLAELPVEARDDGWQRMSDDGHGRVFDHDDRGRLGEHAASAPATSSRRSPR